MGLELNFDHVPFIREQLVYLSPADYAEVLTHDTGKLYSHDMSTIADRCPGIDTTEGMNIARALIYAPPDQIQDLGCRLVVLLNEYLKAIPDDAPERYLKGVRERLPHSIRLIPTFLKSIHFLGTFDPEVGQDLYDDTVDVRDIFSWSGDKLSIEYEDGCDVYVDGVTSIILFNVIYNAESAHKYWNSAHSTKVPIKIVCRADGSFQIFNNSEFALSDEELERIRTGRIEHEHYGLTLIALFSSLIDRQIAVEQNQFEQDGKESWAVILNVGPKFQAA